MFIRIDHKSGEEQIISSEMMSEILEDDLGEGDVDEALTEMVMGSYKHRNREALFCYRP